MRDLAQHNNSARVIISKAEEARKTTPLGLDCANLYFVTAQCVTILT